MSTPNTFVADNRWSYRTLYRVAWWLLVPAFRLFTRMTISGAENIPTEGPFILAPVHRSYVDTPIAASMTRRRMRYMGKDSMWKYERLGRFFCALGAFPVSRGTADREALKRARLTLEEYHDGLVLFPEGERKQGPVVFPPMEGAIYLAAKSQVPIIPVGIGGSEWVMPKKAKFLHPKKVHVEIGEPIMPPSASGGMRAARAANAELTEVLHRRLQELFDIAMSKVPESYDDPPSSTGGGSQNPTGEATAATAT